MPIFAPILVLYILIFTVIIPSSLQNNRKIIKSRKLRRKEKIKMDITLIQKYINRNCIIYINGGLTAKTGTVTEVSDNWLTVRDKKGKLTTINCDYISSIGEK